MADLIFLSIGIGIVHLQKSGKCLYKTTQLRNKLTVIYRRERVWHNDWQSHEVVLSASCDLHKSCRGVYDFNVVIRRHESPTIYWCESKWIPAESC